MITLLVLFIAALGELHEFDEEYEREQIRLLNEKLDDRAESIGNVPQRLWKYNIGDYLKSADEIYNRELALETKDEEERGGWVVHIVSIRRVIKVTKTGGVMRSAVVVVAGDGKGTAGFAKARAPDVQTASQKAFRVAAPLRQPPSPYISHGRSHGIEIGPHPYRSGPAVAIRTEEDPG